jgi:hypothetical protein
MNQLVLKFAILVVMMIIALVMAIDSNDVINRKLMVSLGVIVGIFAYKNLSDFTIKN